MITSTNKCSDILLPKIAVVIPCFRVKEHILRVIDGIGSEVSKIYVVDDCCPEQSGKFVSENNSDSRVNILWNPINLGVGGAVLSGYRQALLDKIDIVVKIDGDNQMDPSLILNFALPILYGKADYTKGNRFFELESVSSMPRVRILGNAGLSFLTKISSGYWDVFDPTNGYTAIHAGVLAKLPLNKVSKNYFFESDMLFRLNLIRAVVLDIPMKAKYADEISNLKISKIIGLFLKSNIRNFLKRIFYNYYLRGMSLASIELPLGFLLLVFGLIFGGIKWVESYTAGISTPLGTIMLAALPILMGFQLILAFLAFDIASAPRIPLQFTLGKINNPISKSTFID